MKIILADNAGFCFGVRAIDQMTTKMLDQHEERIQAGEHVDAVYSYGELVHNAQYVERQKSRGLIEIDELDKISDLPAGSKVIFRAHGVEKREREAMEQAGVETCDGTCSILLSIYKRAQKKNEEGYQVAIVGDPDHPEIRAMRTYFDEDTIVVQTVEEAKEVIAKRPLYIISQTTNQKSYFEEIAQVLETKQEGSIAQNTICNATRDRQASCEEVSKVVDAMIVIGGKNSSNTEKLAQVARKHCKNVYKIEVISDLPLQTIRKFNTIGITAGASTPDWIIQEVVTRMDNFSNEEFMEQVKDSMIKIYPRDIVKGTVIVVKDDEMYVDIKFRADGIVKAEEMTDEQRADTHAAFHEGEDIDVYVIKLDDGEGNVVLSTRRVEGLKNWQKLVDMYEANELVEAKVTGENTGGLTVSVMGINGFIPASQITTYYVKNFKQFVGETLECKIVSIDEKKRRVVLSSRAVKEEQLDSVWDGIVVGEKVKGTVVRMTEFGAFVDLGGVDGLIHVSDISWDRIGKPADILEIGQELESVVLKANRERNRISLGLKQLTPKPFEIFAQNNKVGDVVKGTVVNMLDFGAFVRLQEGVEGLIHVSQIANRHIEKPSDELSIGDEIEVKIMEVDQERQRIALSVRALTEKPQEESYEGEAAPRQRDRKQFENFNTEPRERKPKKERTRAPRQEVNASALNFDENSDIGNNLGDLIALKLEGLKLSDAPVVAEEEEVEAVVEAPVAEVEATEEVVEAEAEEVAADVEAEAEEVAEVAETEVEEAAEVAEEVEEKEEV